MAAGHDFSTWPRRGEAAKQLGISVATLRRHEGKRINPIKDKNGDHRFDPGELAALGAQLRRSARTAVPKPPRTDTPPPAPPRDSPPEPRVSGPATKRAFEMFEQNNSRAQVAIELGEPIENVNWLYENYLSMSGKMAPEAARTAVRGMRELRSRPSPERPVVRPVDYEKHLRSRPRELLDATERDELDWIDKIDARQRLYEERWRAVLAERQSSATTSDAQPDGSLERELLARPPDSLTPTERAFVEMIERT